MTAVITPPRSVPAAVAIGAGAVSAAWFVASDPTRSLQAMVGLAAAAVLLARPNAALALLAGSFYFDDYLNTGQSFVNPGKVIGVLAAGAFLIEWVRRRPPLRPAPHFIAIVAFAMSLVLSFSVARFTPAALVIASRYVMFFLLFFLVVQLVRTADQAGWMADVVVAAAGASALVGLRNYFFDENWYRAGGPIGDPGDFGFMLATTIPLAIYRLSAAPGSRRLIAGAAVPLMFAAVLMSFSRAALVGLAVAGAWAIMTRRLAVRWGVAALACLLLSGTAAYLVQPELVQTTFEMKENVAEQNVESRLRLWRVAIQQFQTSPGVGVGPGNFEPRYVEFEFPEYIEAQTTHNAYLHVLAELGVAGLAVFVAFLVVSWRSLRQRRPDDPDADRFLTALAAGFVVALVGALFMTQQFYSPMWFLPALGVALLLSTRSDRSRSRA